MIAVGYIRKSNEQKDRADVKSTEVQRDLVTKFIASKGWTLGEVYIEAEGMSGALSEEQRPALARLVADAKRRKFQVVVVVEQSRLFRDTVGLVTLLSGIEKAGVTVWSTRESR